MNGNLNIVAILRTNELRSAMADVCYDMNGTKLDLRVGTLEQVTRKPTGIEPDLLILDVDPHNHDEMEALRGAVQVNHPQTPVIVTAAGPTLEDVRKLMRLGVADFVPQPMQRHDLLTAIEVGARARRSRKSADQSRGRVVSFLKGGGGAGATTIATQSGCWLASSLGRNERTVCLLDFDIQGGMAALYLDLNDRVGLTDLVESTDRLDTDLLHGVMTKHASGLSVLAAPREVMPLDSITPEFVERAVNVIQNHFDFVLIDLPSVWTTWSFEAIRRSDETLLVAQMTVPGVRQARRQLDTLKAEGIEDDHIKIILNRHERRWGSTIKPKEVEKVLGRKIDFFIANDYRAVREALDQGLALSAVSKRSKVFKSIAKLGGELVKANTLGQTRREPQLVQELRV